MVAGDHGQSVAGGPARAAGAPDREPRAGDVFTTGSPTGVGKIEDGDTMITTIEKISEMPQSVKRDSS